MNRTTMARHGAVWFVGAIFIVLACQIGPAREIEAQDVARIADAIWRVEGGRSTRYPYGVKTPKASNEKDARRICENTIRNNWIRWERSGSHGEFIEFLGSRYCPKSSDPVGHKRWIVNMKKILNKT